MAPVALASSSSSPPPLQPSRSRRISAASSNRSSVNSGVGLGLRIPNAASSSFFEKDVGPSSTATPSSNSPPTSVDTPRAPPPSSTRSRGATDAKERLDGLRQQHFNGSHSHIEDVSAGVGLHKESTIRQAKRIASASRVLNKDHVRVCDDFRDALSRTPLSLLQQTSSNNPGPSQQTSASTSGAERQKDDATDIANLLQQARLLSNVAPQSLRNVSANGSATPPMEAVKRAIKDPDNDSRSNAQHAGDFTSASTPEGAIGRLALPPLTLNDGQDDISLSQSMFDALNMDVEPSSIATDASRNQDEVKATKHTSTTTSSSSSSDDQEALRSGLRFVLSCYDELSKRAKEDRGVADAIITSVVSEGRKLKAPASATADADGNANGKAINAPSSSSSQWINHQRMRTGSILKALARGKTNAALPGIKGGYTAWASGVTSPARATQMDFDAEPAYLVGPSNRLGMATHSPWQQNAATSLNDPARSDKLSTDGDSRSRSSSGPSTTSAIAPTEEVRQLRRKLIVVEEEKKRLMSEMESLSEELFLQANEMVKQERIKSNAIEKEFESLKRAMAASKVQQSNAAAAQDAAVAAVAAAATQSSSTAFSPSDFEAGTQGDKEAMMLSAIAQAARECAEAEEEAGEWRMHCEELQSRCSILEEALYNTMSLLAENGGQEASDETFAGAETGIMPHREYAESNASFYSVDEIGSNKAGEEDVEQQEPGSQNISSDLSSSGLCVDHKKDTQRFSLQRPASLATEEGSVESSSYSHPSSAQYSATSPRNSVVSSRRQSRQIILPPRLPEPSSPLPSIPDPDTADGCAAANVRRRSGVGGSSNGRARGDSLGESKLRSSFTTEAKSAVVVPTSMSTPNVLAPAFVDQPRKPKMEENLSPKDTSAPFRSISARPRSLLGGSAEQDDESALFSSSFAFDDNGWDERRRQADKALLNDEAGRQGSGTPSSLAIPSASAAIQGLGVGLNRRHSLAYSTRSSDSKVSSSGSFNANLGQLSRNGSTVIKEGLRLFGGGSKSAAEGQSETSTKTYIPVKNVGRKMSAPSSTPHIDHGEPKRRQSVAGGNVSSSSTGASAKKSAKSAILGHMPPALPRGRSVASIASANGSLDSDDQRTQQHKAQYSPTEEHYMRFAATLQNPPTQDVNAAFGRRRRFNEIATKQQQQQLDVDDDYPAQQY